MNIGGSELLLIVLIIVVMFGAKKIPELAKGLGSGIRDFKQAMREGEQKKDGIEENDRTKV